MIQRYIRENYDSILEIAKVITKGKKPDYEDLAHEIMIILLTSNREKMDSLVETKKIKFYIIRTTINQYRSSSSRYFKKYRKENKTIQKETNAIREHLIHQKKLDLTLSKIYDEEILEFISDKLNDVEWFEKNCFAIYYGDELTLDAMSKLTGISRNTLYRAIRDTRNYLQDEIEESRFRR